MSEDIKFKDPIHGLIEKKALLETKKTEVLEKELVIRERRAEIAINKIEESDKNAEIAKYTNYGAMSDAEIEQTQQENIEYMKAARNKMCFINPRFNKVVPFFRKNLILVGGRTGDGKSTTVANIIRETISRVNPETGKKRRVLVITNEERTEDVFNRVTCLIKGWAYVNHDQFTSEQIETFNNFIKKLSADGMLTVIDNDYGGSVGTTTTLEGVCQIFDNLIANKEYYDVVIIDYYQNIQESRNNPGMVAWQVQEAMAGRLDGYKNIYPAPIVLLAQVTPQDAENRTPFKVRIEGRKSILNACTCCLEMIANREEFSTEWVVHKSRFNESVGQKITTGYDMGRFVLHTDEFKETVARKKAIQAAAEIDKTLKMPSEKKEGDTNE